MSQREDNGKLTALTMAYLLLKLRQGFSGRRLEHLKIFLSKKERGGVAGVLSLSEPSLKDPVLACKQIKKLFAMTMKAREKNYRILFFLFFDKLFDIFCLVNIIALSSFQRT
ncbi:hypothetical protein, partial [Chlamydia suis]